jgi:hypothetical protein
MPDSPLPPGWGLAPFDERDLDAVLSGQTADVPVALRPVADVLASLRAGPVPAELYGEANAMAEFRALGLGQGGPGRPAQTMLLEALPTGSRARPGRQPPRHRARPPRRHPLRRATLRPAVLSAVAAAAVIVVAVLVTGNFGGSLRDIAHTASPSAGASFAKRSAGHSAAPRVETTSVGLEPTAPASVAHSTAPAQSPSQTCRAYYTSLVRPQGPSAWAARLTLWQQLTKLAGTHDPFQVYQYCAPYLQDLLPADAPAAGPNQAPADTAPGSRDNSDLGQQNGAAANSRAGEGNGSVSSGQVGNGHGDASGNGH